VVTVTVGKLLIGAAVLSVVAVLVPAALAERPDDREGTIGVGAVVAAETTPFQSIGTADTVEARIRAGLDARGNVVSPVRPDDRGEPMGPGAVVSPTRPDDIAGPIGVGSVEVGSPTEPVATPGTDWSDPFVVGAIAAVIALLGVTVVYVVEHGRRGGGTSGRGTPGRPITTH
jgi:hypothetical protein